MTLGQVFRGGCLCRQLRFEARGEPLYAGYCYCGDCRRASGSGFVAFMGFESGAVRFSGQSHTFTSRSSTGSDAVRNSCPVCSALVFGGIVGQDSSHTLYAGALDDPSLFKPRIAIFTRDRPAWAWLPPDLIAYETMPTE